MKEIKTNKRIEKIEKELINEGFVKMVDHSDYFWIHPDGRVYNFKSQKFRTVSLTEDGYYDTTISNGAYSNKSYPLHRLLAYYFILNPMPDVTTDINHIDGNKSNNELSNLEWVTHKENMTHSVDNNLKTYSSGKKGSHLNEEIVSEIKKMLYQGHTHSQIAKQFNTTRPCITQIASGNRWAEVTIDTTGIEKLNRIQPNNYKILKIEVNGEEKTLFEFAVQYGVNVELLKNRYKSGIRGRDLISHKIDKKPSKYDDVYETINGEAKSISEWIEYFGAERKKTTMRYLRGKRGMELFE